MYIYLYISIYIYLFIFILSRGPIGWIYPAEIYPQMIRANAMGVTTSCSYLFNLLISLVSPIMFRDIMWRSYIFFAAMCLMMAFVVQRYYPETRGRSLEEIQLIFSGALIDQRPDAHHPAMAAEALLHLEQIQHRDKRDRMANNTEYPFNLPVEWSEGMEVSSPRNVTRVLNNRTSHDTMGSDIISVQPRRPSLTSWIQPHHSSSSIELSTKYLSGERDSDASQQV